jgi:hypothetical protein
LADLRKAIERGTGAALRLRGVHPLPFYLPAAVAAVSAEAAVAAAAAAASGTARPSDAAPAPLAWAVCAHLPPDAAALVESGDLDALLAAHGATYYPGS